MHDATPILAQLGMNELQASLYLACYQYDEMSVAGLARLLKKPRTTLYHHVERLVQQYFLTVRKGPKGNRYSAISWEQLIALVGQQQSRYQQLGAQLTALKPLMASSHNQLGHLPKVQYYEGRQAVKSNVYEQLDRSGDGRFIFDIDALIQHSNRNLEHCIQEFSQTKGKVWNIMNDTALAREYAKRIQSFGQEVRFVSPHRETIQSDTIIIGDSYTHITYTHHIVAFAVNNPILYRNQIMMFDLARESLSSDL